MPTPLGLKIKSLRDEKGYTLEELAKLADSSKSYIWELENKAPPRPSGEKVSKIATVLGVTVDYLLGADDGMSKETATDAQFYRNYRKMDPKIKEKIRSMAELLNDDSS